MSVSSKVSNSRVDQDPDRSGCLLWLPVSDKNQGKKRHICRKEPVRFVVFKLRKKIREIRIERDTPYFCAVQMRLNMIILKKLPTWTSTLKMDEPSFISILKLWLTQSCRHVLVSNLYLKVFLLSTQCSIKLKWPPSCTALKEKKILVKNARSFSLTCESASQIALRRTLATVTEQKSVYGSWMLTSCPHLRPCHLWNYH